jgi:outer membrane protein OmpA-like peptidoglycan-associated protein
MIDDLEIIPASKTICTNALHVKDSLYAIHERHSRGKAVDTVVVAVADSAPAVKGPVEQVRKIDTLKINNIQFDLDSFTLKSEATLDSLRGFFAGRDIKKV